MLRVIELALVLVIIYFALRLGSYFLQRYEARQAYDVIVANIERISQAEGIQADQTEDKDQGEKASPAPAPSLTKENQDQLNYQAVMDYLRKVSPHIVAYLQVDGTSISYPVVQAEDNEYFLWRDIQGQDNVQGSIFMDYRSDPKLQDKNTVIYGHLMRRGDMFQPIKNFYDEAYSKESPKTFSHISNQGLYKGRFFSIIEAPAHSHDVLLFDEKEDRPSFLEDLRASSASDLTYQGTFNQDIKILTLSTCVEDYDEGYRTLLFGIFED